MADVTLTASMRNNLVSLQNTQVLLSQTQERLATGLKVNSALDNPVNYFAAAAHTQRANDLTGRKDGMNEAIQAIKAANTGITGLQNLLGAASGLIESARTATAADRATLGTQYNQVLAQINKLVSDSGYKGTDFLSGSSTTLDVLFNENGSNKLTLTGFNANWSALGTTAAATVTLSAGTKTSTTTGNFTSAGTKYSTVAHTVSAGGLAVYTNSSGPTITGVNSAANWSVASTFTTSLNTAADTITSATAALQTQASKLSSNLSIINARLDFTTSMVNVEKTGADNLTLADTNQEGANMLALQTRQSLGVTSLSLASQANQAILRLF